MEYKLVIILMVEKVMIFIIIIQRL